jgi:adenine phosphoribosyltransferase
MRQRLAPEQGVAGALGGCDRQLRVLQAALALTPRQSAVGDNGILLARFHDELVARLQYFDGHSDTIGLWADGRFLAQAGAAMADPFRGAGVRKVAGIEARGFVLATAAALELGVGFVAVRKQGSIHPGAKAELAAPPDWRGLETVLRLQRHVIEPGELSLWSMTGPRREARRSPLAALSRAVGVATPASRSWLTSSPLACASSSRP